MANHIRISDHLLRTTRTGKLAFTALRAVVYGVLGVFLEVISFPITRIGRGIPIIKYVFAFDYRVDPRLGLDGPWHTPLATLFGQSSLWMLPIYALVALSIELLYRRWLFRRSWLIRAISYALVIQVFEWATGLAVKAITGYAIWMYADRGNIMHMTSLFSLPIWMMLGLFVELLYRELMDAEIRSALEAELRRSVTARR